MTISVGHFQEASRANAGRRIVTTKDGTVQAVKQSRWERFRNVALGPSKRDREINKLAHDGFLRAIGRASDADTQMRAADLLASSAAAGKPLSDRRVSAVLGELGLTTEALAVRNYTQASAFAKSDAGRQAYNDLKSKDPDFKELYPSFDEFASSVSHKLRAPDENNPRRLTKADFQARLGAWTTDHFKAANGAEARRLATIAQSRHPESARVGGEGFPNFIARQVGQDPDVGTRRLSTDEVNAYLRPRVAEGLREDNTSIADDFVRGYTDREFQAKASFTPFKDLLNGGLNEIDPRYGGLAKAGERFYPKLGREEQQRLQDSVRQAIVDTGTSRDKIVGPKDVVDTAEAWLGAYFARRPGALERQAPELARHIEDDLRDPDTAPPFDQVRAGLAGFAFPRGAFLESSALADRLFSGEDVIHPGVVRPEMTDRRGRHMPVEEIDDLRFGRISAGGEEAAPERARRAQWTEVVGVVRDLESHVDVLGESTEGADAKRARLEADRAILDGIADSTASDLRWRDNEIFQSLRAEVGRQLDALDNPPARDEEPDETPVEPFQPAPGSAGGALRREAEGLRAAASAAGNVAMPRATQAEPDVREVRKEEIEQLLVPGLVPRDLAVDDDATEAERLEAARNVYAANLSAAPSYPRLAKFTIQTSQPGALEPRSVFGRLQAHLQRQFGIALSNDDVRTLVSAPLGQRSGERDSRADLERDHGMLAALGQKLAQDAKARDVPIVRALQADITANLAELDEALKAGDGRGPSVQPPPGGGRRRRVGFNV